MDGTATTDYEALARQYGGTTVKKGSTAPDASKPAIDYTALARQFGGTSKPAPSPADFTANPKGEGLYRMSNIAPARGEHDLDTYLNAGPGEEIQVPYSKVKDALQAGYRLHFDEKPRYTKDSAHQGVIAQGANWIKNNWQANTETIPDVPLTEVDPNHPVASRLNRMGNAAQNVYQMPWNTLVSTERGLVGLTQLPAHAVETIKQIYEGDPQGMQTLSETITPEFLKPLYKSYQDDLQQYGPTAAISNLTGNFIALYLTGKIGKEGGYALNAVKEKAAQLNPVRVTMEAITGTGPRMLKEMADKKLEEKAVFETGKAKAENAQKGDIMEYRNRLAETEKQLAEEHQKATEKTETANQLTREKAREAHDAAVRKVREKNLRTNAKHAEELRQTDEQLAKRRAEEEGVRQDTENYYTKEDLERAKAKSKENQSWKPWHDVARKTPLSAEDVSKKIDTATKGSPEAKAMMQRLIPSPEDAVEMQTPYGLKLDNYASENFNGKKFINLEKADRDIVVEQLALDGITPDPLVDFTDPSAVGVTLEAAQRAQAILGRNIWNGKYGFDGIIRSDMERVQNVLRQIVTQESDKAGILPDLKAGRIATQEFQKAFGRERHIPRTELENREYQANPKQYKEREDEERIAAAEQIAPELAEAHRKVKARNEALRKMPTEDQLQKKSQRLSKPPSIGDLRAGYALEQEPTYKPPTVGDLRQGHALQPPPLRPPESSKMIELSDAEGNRFSVTQEAFQKAHQPGGTEFPEGVKVITPEDYIKEKQLRTAKDASELRRMGLRRAIYATLTGIPFGILEAFSGKSEGSFRRGLAGGVAAGGVVLAGSHVLANVLESLDVQRWLSQVTPREAARWEKLSPEQRAMFSEDMKEVIAEADRKNIPVSPALRQFAAKSAVVTAGAASHGAQEQKQTLEDIKKKAQELQQSTPPPASTPPPPPPGAGASIPMDNLKKIIEQAQALNPGTKEKPVWTHEYNPVTNSIVAV